MGFNIPNYGPAIAGGGVGDQAEPDSVDFQILGNDVCALVYDPAYPSNGLVEAQVSANDEVKVGAYKAIINGTYYTGAATLNKSLGAGGSSARFDLVVITPTGLVVRNGTEDATNPKFPDILSTDVVLAAVYRPGGGAATVTTPRIVDKRTFVHSNTAWVTDTEPTNVINGDLWVSSNVSATGQSNVRVRANGSWENLAEYIPVATANTASALVQRDSFGNFSAGIITAALTGVASQATLAAKASTLANGGSNGSAMTFTWTTQSGSPQYVWGSADGVTSYPYSVANLVPNYATTSGTASDSNLLSGYAASSTGTYNNTIALRDVNGHLWANAVHGISGTSSFGNVTASAVDAIGHLYVTSGGSPSAVDIGWTDDSNTGLYNNEANKIKFATNGVLRYVIDSSGGNNASSLRYKTDIQNATFDIDELYQIRVITYKPLEGSEPNSKAPRVTGVIAEELDAIESCRQFVLYDDQGRPDAVAYDRLAVAYIELLKDHETRIAALEAK